MGYVTDKSADVYRDFVSAGVPASGHNEPAKLEIRSLFSFLDGALAALLAGFVADQAVVVYAARSSLYANLTPADRTLGLVYNDGSNNGLYIKNGAAGSGSWTATGLMLQGQQGERGPIGPDGKSVLQTAIDTGYVPAGTTEAQFIAKIVGQITAAAAQSADNASNSAAGALDSKQQAGVSLTAITTALAGYPNNATLTIPVASRTILAAMPQNTATPAYLFEKGREGTFIWQPGDMTALVTADPAQGVAVAPGSAPSGSSGAWVRNTGGSTVNVRWFGAKGDCIVDLNGDITSGTDDSVAVQRAIDFVAYLGGGTVFFPNGRYLIARPLQDTAAANAQIVLPKINDIKFSVSITLQGETSPIHSGPRHGGAIIRTSLTAGPNDNVASIIGSKNPHGSTGYVQDNITWVGLRMYNLTFEVPQNPQISCVDARFVHVLECPGVKFTVAGGFTMDGVLPHVVIAEPTNLYTYGLLGPSNNGPYWTIVDGCSFLGLYTGMFQGELTRATHIGFSTCKVGIQVPTNQHSSYYGCIESLTVATTIKGSGDCIIDVGMIDTERTTGAPAWIVYGKDIDDPNNFLRGKIHTIRDDYAAATKFNVVGGKNLEWDVVRSASQTSEVFDRLFPGFQDLVDAKGLHKTVNDRGGIAWSYMATKQPNNAGTIAVTSYCNFNLPGPKFRVAQTYVALDGAQDAGAYFIGTRSAGGDLVDQIKFDSKRNIIFLNADNHLATPLNGDIAGRVAVPAAGDRSEVRNFLRTYGSPPVVNVTPASPLPAGVTWWVDIGATNFVVRLTAALPAGTTATFCYQVMGG